MRKINMVTGFGLISGSDLNERDYLNHDTDLTYAQLFIHSLENNEILIKRTDYWIYRIKGQDGRAVQSREKIRKLEEKY